MCTTKLTQGRSVNSYSGITLIALVVTIVVLLILASVSITVVFGDNGLLKLAKEAGEKTNEAGENDLRQVAMAEALMSFENKEYKGVTIPAGFAPTRIEGEDSIEEGLVIIDSKGNEFVWVPVPDIKNFIPIKDIRCSGEIHNIDDHVQYVPNTPANEKQEYDLMYESVKNNKGFFIGRYETGIENDTVIIKKNSIVYNNVSCENSSEDISGGAIEISRNFCVDNNYSSVTSTLCYGIQFDAILQFFDSNYITGTCSETSLVYDGRSNGNFTGKIALTGSSEKYKIKNIYDIIGNVCEWTMESVYNKSYLYGVRIQRGLCYNLFDLSGWKDGQIVSTSERWTNFQTQASENLGFRIALYLK